MNFHALASIELDEVSAMFWYVLFGFFAAFGVLCALWALFGQFLPASGRCEVAVRCQKRKEIPILRRFCWLREMGLLGCDLTVLDSELNPVQQHYIRQRYPYIHFSTRQEWLAGKRKECVAYATGNGDPAGHHCRSGVSEL